LRAAILFAGAGLDRSLKSLVLTSIESLLSSDLSVRKRFTDFAAQAVTDRDTQSISPREFVTLFLQTGVSPESVLRERWIRQLTDGSAQSAERVEELASALGVEDSSVRSRIKPNPRTPTPLQLAFTARNLIAHELDVTLPNEEVRKALERIRAVRKVSDTENHVTELLSVAQLIVNDVSGRLARV
jgi:predicted ATP-dependent endonuclease of OLD family